MAGVSAPARRTGRGRTGRGRTGAWLVGGAVSAALLAAVLWQVDPAAARTFATAADPAWFASAFAAYALVNLLSCLRLVRSLRRAAGVPTAMDITVVHGILLAFLPARLGDAYYPALLSRRLGVPLGAALGNLLLLRLLDGATVALLFVAAALVPAHGAGTPAGGSAVAVAGAGAAVLMMAGLVAAPRLLGTLGRALARRRQGRLRPVVKVALGARRWLVRLPTGLRLELFAWTIASWTAALACLGMILRGLGGPALSAWDVVFIGAGLNLAAALPVQTVGGFGLAEATLAGLMALRGLDLGDAAALSVLTRLAWLALPFALAGLWLGARALARHGQAIRTPAERSGR